jgi:uncharacterized protein (DUF2141 family)
MTVKRRHGDLWRSTRIFAVVLLLCAPAWTGGLTTVTLSGKVIGASGKYAIFVALWDAHGFLARPVQQVRIAPRAAPVFHFQVSAGRWALSAFEDSNGNGVLDMGLFGPKEPNGFWHAFHAWRKPRFTDVAASVDRDTNDADIRLRR